MASSNDAPYDPEFVAAPREGDGDDTTINPFSLRLRDSLAAIIAATTFIVGFSL